MKLELVEIPGVKANPGDVWKIRALVLDGRAAALELLAEWERSEHQDFKRILKSMVTAMRDYRTCTPKHVKRCTGGFPKTYELIAYTGVARLMFFYDEENRYIICTNGISKSRGNQNNAFQICNLLREYYCKHNNVQP